MLSIRLVRAVTEPSGRGPGNGQYALQKALRARQPEWLTIGGKPLSNEIPWFWCWLDRKRAVACARNARPFIAGPNMLFVNSRAPGAVPGERDLLNAASCRLLFTESEWYRQLIDRHRGTHNRASIILWPYPIDPQPMGPTAPPHHDLLVYVKNGRFPGLLSMLQKGYPHTQVIHYGKYRQEELWETARRARCCVYLADDDRGPLALAEILLSGCPTVGLPTGVPFVEHGRTGVVLDEITTANVPRAVEQCHALDRHAVRAAALEQFDTQRIVDTVLSALSDVAGVSCRWPKNSH